MPPKKAAKKAVKKAAKKSAKHHYEPHGGKDLRRAYEHLGRLEALQSALPGSTVDEIQSLIEHARHSLSLDEAKVAAELLRACEHLAFGALAPAAKDSGVGEALEAAIREHYEHQLERAADRWDEHEDEPGREITGLYERALERAEAAYTKGAFRRALEFIRAAEALSHAGKATTLQLGGGIPLLPAKKPAARKPAKKKKLKP